jgi:predicted nucleotidyltransferase
MGWMKTVGMIEPIRAALKPYRDKIDLAFVYGSVAKDKDTAKSDIDLMISGNELALSEIYGALQKAEKSLMRTINPNLTTAEEWNHKVVDKNSFVRNILQQPKLFVFGTNELDNLVRTGALKVEPADQKEFDGLFNSGRTRLADAKKGNLALESQFDLAYNAAHALSLERRCDGMAIGQIIGTSFFRLWPTRSVLGRTFGVFWTRPTELETR